MLGSTLTGDANVFFFRPLSIKILPTTSKDTAFLKTSVSLNFKALIPQSISFLAKLKTSFHS